MGVVLGEDQRLRDLGAAGKELGKQPVAERADDGADLVRGDDRAVELLPGVNQVVVEQLPAGPAGELVAAVYVEAGLDPAALFGDAGPDAVDVVADVDAVGDRPLVAVFHHQVLVEEAEGLLRGRGGEADEEGVEVLQHLAPEMVD
ncbi:MAG: hypothetical protein AMQ22_01348 [Candidatus Methanofastidiosum methylothiophilum]|uniref:Uncharacterized protein n=1 Tax=Candidatus Methanofastidiosum methylothiophilum TaxID=1705564 RepID=A0A150J1V7_9EURY|nr:MAG: hypothetical protein AMQ22_01348 [Candidatus Methanofastidiosum methylthiophilus]